MKKIASILTLAILGTSSLALADHDATVTASPDISVRDHRDGRYDNRDNRFDDRFDASLKYDYTTDDDAGFRRDNDGNYWRGQSRYIRAQSQPRWVQLGTKRGGKTVIQVGKDAGQFQSLRLDVNGFMRISHVVVMFENGTRQVVKLNSSGRRNAPLMVDLTGNRRAIAFVKVFASEYSRGTVTVSGLQAPRYHWRRHVAQY
jgi:hypothetical protein